MSFAYFGEKWDAPAWDDGVLVPTPVGERCALCEEPVEAGDSGVRNMTLREAKPGQEANVLMGSGTAAVWRSEPMHLECFLRSVRGSIAHLEGRCSRHGGAEPEAPELSLREDARAVLAWLRNEKRMPPSS